VQLPIHLPYISPTSPSATWRRSSPISPSTPLYLPCLHLHCISLHLPCCSSSTALYVTLTTRAHGRFSDNAFAMPPGERQLTFVPLGTPDPKGLAASLRVEHLQPYLSHQPAVPVDPAAPAATAAKAVNAAIVSDQRVEYLSEPRGVDEARPRFSWSLSLAAPPSAAARGRKQACLREHAWHSTHSPSQPLTAALHPM
jgi:hypothetical protein